VNARPANERCVGQREGRGEENEGPCLGAAQPAVEGDELLEGASLVELGVVEAPDHDVRDVREAVRSKQMHRSVGREDRKRVLALDAILAEIADAARAERQGAVLLGVDEQPADVRVPPQGGDEGRMTFVDFLEREPARFPQQVDESQIPRAEDDDLLVTHIVLRPLRLGGLAGRFVQREADHGVLLVAACVPGDHAGRQ
jgi:hypothetical protein